MKSCSHLFSSYTPAKNKNIKIANGLLAAIVLMGSIQISQLLNFHDILHVPNFSCNFLSINKLTSDHNYHINLYHYNYQVIKLASMRMINNEKSANDSSFINEINLTKEVHSSCFKSNSIFDNYEKNL